ncbi:MAG: hypothetical protein BM557_01170 [Flavobacterium sp. MedPE-SWcel]|nr:MAG: hypothetical protein BM557_01170 [Flavobacterium sp. MedPE-SWcel]
MPKVTKILNLDITSEIFLNECSDTEIYELFILLQSDRFQDIILKAQAGEEAINHLKKDFNARNKFREVGCENGDTNITRTS